MAISLPPKFAEGSLSQWGLAEALSMETLGDHFTQSKDVARGWPLLKV